MRVVHIINHGITPIKTYVSEITRFQENTVKISNSSPYVLEIEETLALLLEAERVADTSC